MYSKNWAEKARPGGGKRKMSSPAMDDDYDLDMDLEEQDGVSSEYDAYVMQQSALVLGLTCRIGTPVLA